MIMNLITSDLVNASLKRLIKGAIPIVTNINYPESNVITWHYRIKDNTFILHFAVKMNEDKQLDYHIAHIQCFGKVVVYLPVSMYFFNKVIAEVKEHFTDILHK